MISQETLQQVIAQLLTTAVPKNLNATSIADQLNALEQSNNVTLSEYGYVMYALEHAGMGGIYHGRLSDPQLMAGYAQEARKFPYVLFVLFTALGQPDMVDGYKIATAELLSRYPGTLDLLPENIQKLTQEALNADSE